MKITKKELLQIISKVVEVEKRKAKTAGYLKNLSFGEYEDEDYEEEIEDFRNKKGELMMRQGSHGFVSKSNKQLFEPLNDLLCSIENPYYKLFQTEELFLDDTDGFVGIIDNSDRNGKGVDLKISIGLNKFIREHLKPEYSGKDYQVVIGDHIYKR